MIANWTKGYIFKITSFFIFDKRLMKSKANPE